MGWIQGAHHTLAWQIEHNGSWHAEIGDRFDDVYLVLGGPARREHQWSVRLAPGQTWRTVPVAVCLVAGGAETAMAALTRYRRAIRRPHPDNAELPVVFNDFMNCLMGDPTADRLQPLVRAAATAGAEVFCIDAGWYDDEAGPPGPGGVPSWWDSVGEWEPSTKRFPNGLGEVMDAIRAAGMVPGLWLEPEIVGVRSPIAAQLPDDAFLRRDGIRIAEWDRYQLDLTHPAARAHLDETVDRLIARFGVGYFKLDYNVDIGPCDGLLEHNRAFLAWLDAVRDRHPRLVIEGCAAGGMRLDGATLSRVCLQSMTDQQDTLLLPPIAAAAPTVAPPEQAAMWAYPQGDRVALAMVTAMLGRVHLSGRLDLLDDAQMAQVADALTVYKGYRHELAHGVPRWPLGMPGWRDEKLALAIDCGAVSYVAVWRRDCPDDVIELPWQEPVAVKALFPRPVEAAWHDGTVRVRLPTPNSAVLLRLVQ